MNKYYFTYGTNSKFPYQGGWSEIEAEDMAMAISIFNAVHKPHTPGCMNCAFIYTSEEFESEEMYNGGNFGARCHERISIKRGKEIEDEQHNERNAPGELHNDTDRQAKETDIVSHDRADDGKTDSI